MSTFEHIGYQNMEDGKKEPFPAPVNDPNEEWVQEYKNQFGTEPTFF